MFTTDVGLAHLGLWVDVPGPDLSHHHGSLDIPTQRILGQPLSLELGQQLFFGGDVLFLLDVFDDLIEVPDDLGRADRIDHRLVETFLAQGD